MGRDTGVAARAPVTGRKLADLFDSMGSTRGFSGLTGSETRGLVLPKPFRAGRCKRWWKRLFLCWSTPLEKAKSGLKATRPSAAATAMLTVLLSSATQANTYHFKDVLRPHDTSAACLPSLPMEDPAALRGAVFPAT